MTVGPRVGFWKARPGWQSGGGGDAGCPSSLGECLPAHEPNEHGGAAAAVVTQRQFGAELRRAGQPVDAFGVGRHFKVGVHRWPKALRPASLTGFPCSGRLNLTFYLVNKTATRLPESLWLRFRPLPPASGPPLVWTMNKLDSDIDPLDIVVNGSRVRADVCARWSAGFVG